jgi:hypothetical protein
MGELSPHTLTVRSNEAEANVFESFGLNST